MKKDWSDKHIQKMLDEGADPTQGEGHPSAQAYATLYSVLKTSPKIDISSDFALRTATLAVKARKQKASQQTYMLTGTIVLAVVLNLTVLFFTYPPFFHWLMAHKAVFLFTAGLYTIIQTCDYWLIRKPNRLNQRISLPDQRFSSE